MITNEMLNAYDTAILDHSPLADRTCGCGQKFKNPGEWHDHKLKKALEAVEALIRKQAEPPPAANRRNPHVNEPSVNGGTIYQIDCLECGAKAVTVEHFRQCFHRRTPCSALPSRTCDCPRQPPIQPDATGAVESAAKVLFCMQHRLSEKAFATARFRGLADAARREARNALAAAAPHLRASVAEEVRAIDIPEHRLHDQLPSDHWYAGQKAMRDKIVTLLEGGGE